MAWVSLKEHFLQIVRSNMNDWLPLKYHENYPSTSIGNLVSTWEMCFWLFKYVHIHKNIVVSFVLILIETSLEMIQPYYYSKVIARALHQDGTYDHDEQMHYIGMVIALKVISEVITRQKQYCQYMVNDEIYADLFKDVVNRDMIEFDKHGAYYMYNMMSTVIELAPFSICGVQNSIRFLFRSLGSIILIWWISPELTIVSIVSISFFSFMEYLRDKFVPEGWNGISQEWMLAKHIYNVLNNIKNVRAFGCQREEIRKVEYLMEKRMKQFVDIRIFECLMECFFCFLIEIGKGINVSHPFVILYGGILIRGGQITIATFFSHQSYLRILKESLNEYREQIFYGTKQRWNARSVLSFIHKVNKVKRDGVLRPSLKSEIKMENISYIYETEEDKKYIKDFNLHIEVGDSIALIGPRGAGKSIIFGMLERFYSPDTGSITVDGVNVEEIDDEYYHKQIALVSQEPLISYRTIKENILYGCDWATEEQMIEAAKMANIHNFISMLKEGYETKCDASGSQMTLGQKQRIAIARALVRNPTILLIDEDTNTESECVIQEALNGCCKDRTVIVIAHRLSTIRNVDKIVVMKEGHAIEYGTHRELMKIKDGTYAKLVNLREEDCGIDSIEDALDDIERIEAVNVLEKEAEVDETATDKEDSDIDKIPS